MNNRMLAYNKLLLQEAQKFPGGWQPQPYRDGDKEPRPAGTTQGWEDAPDEGLAAEILAANTQEDWVAICSRWHGFIGKGWNGHGAPGWQMRLVAIAGVGSYDFQATNGPGTWGHHTEGYWLP